MGSDKLRMQRSEDLKGSTLLPRLCGTIVLFFVKEARLAIATSFNVVTRFIYSFLFVPVSREEPSQDNEVTLVQ